MSERTARFVEMHMIQSLPATPNRDDTGRPKTIMFGGDNRSRVSSQSWKRAIRMHPYFRQMFAAGLATRTRKLIHLLVERSDRPDEQALEVYTALVGHILGKVDEEKRLTAVAFYLSDEEIDKFSQVAEAAWDDLLSEETRKEALAVITKKWLETFAGRTKSPAIALFGRMMAARPKLGIEAAVQAAHAIGTHHLQADLDYFTAIDDLADEGEASAAMLGYKEFAAATFYRYYAIDWRQLLRNLSHNVTLARKTVEAFVKTAVVAVPGGGIHGTAHNCRPALVMTVVRSAGQPMNMINAFDPPVYAGRSGIVGASIAALNEFWTHQRETWGSLEHITDVGVLLGQPGVELDGALGGCVVANIDVLSEQVLAHLE